jgi:peptidoglycan/LPS O-acetylase OafA/YrhL
MPLKRESVGHSTAFDPGPTSLSPNFLSIQALRAIAALFVVAHHAFETWTLRINPEAPGFVWINGASGVDIFFVISGFVMVTSSRRLLSDPCPALTFMRHRIVRIVPLYWLLTSLKVLLVFWFADLVLRSSLDPDYILRSYLFIPVVDGAGHFRPLLPVGWTLTYEFLFYALFALALGLAIDVLHILIPAFALIVVLAVVRNESWPAWTVLFSTIVMEFLSGVALARKIGRGWSLGPPVAWVLMLSGFALIAILPEGSENMRVVYWGLPAFAIVAGAVSLEARFGRRLPAVLLSLGDASYSIYLIHGFALPVLGVGIAALHWTGLGSKVFTIIASLVVGLTTGWFTYALVERPMLRWMKPSVMRVAGGKSERERTRVTPSKI